MEFWIPYGTTEVPVRVPDDNFYKILAPPKPTQTRDPAAVLSKSLDNPIGGASISSLFKGGSAAIVVDPMVPAEFIQAAIEQVKTRLAQLGVSPITVFVRKRSCATSMSDQLATDIIQVEPSQGSFAEIGKTPSGTRVSLRNDLLACNVKVCLNMVTPHFATGFTGGPEAIVPGVASQETVAANRSLLIQGIPSHLHSWGPVLTDMFDASKLAGPIYNIALVPDGFGGVDSVFSGELEISFKEATSRYLQLHSPRIDRKPDIIVMSAGQTLGMDLYHSVRILSNAWDIARKDGTLILAAECYKGLGDLSFLDYSRKFEDRKTLSSELRRHFKLGAHVSYLLKEALERNRIQLVSVLPDHYVRMFNLKSAKTASAAVLSSIRAEGKEAKILIMTRGDLTLPTIQQT